MWGLRGLSRLGPEKFFKLVAQAFQPVPRKQDSHAQPWQCPPYTTRLRWPKPSLAAHTLFPSFSLGNGKKDCREDHPAFFLGDLGAFGVKIKNYAAAGKTLYLRNRGPGLSARRPHRGRLPGLLAGGGLFLPLLPPPHGSGGQGLGGHPGGRPLFLRERHELYRLGGGPAPDENLHGGVSPLPGVGGPDPGGG